MSTHYKLMAMLPAGNFSSSFISTPLFDYSWGKQSIGFFLNFVTPLSYIADGDIALSRTLMQIALLSVTPKVQNQSGRGSFLGDL